MLYMTNFDLKVQAPWLQHFIQNGEGQFYIYPRMHSVTMGGTPDKQVDDGRLVDPGDSQGIVECCKQAGAVPEQGQGPGGVCGAETRSEERPGGESACPPREPTGTCGA
ncbi:unnamed protein product [Coregonus sp. 'balchen']|nr:unnamed protein product [Coregonus sp. 'balchen']